MGHLNILHIIPVFSPFFGGSVTVVREVAAELARRGHNVTVMSTTALNSVRDFANRPIYSKTCRYLVKLFPRNLKFIPFNISFSMLSYFKKSCKSYDILHVHAWRHFQDMFFTRSIFRDSVPYMVQFHGAFSRMDIWRILKLTYDYSVGVKILKDAKKVIALSTVEARHLLSFGISSQKIAIIPNGIDVDKYRDLPEERKFKRFLGIDDCSEIVLYLGRIDRSKGIDFLIYAFHDLMREYKVKDVKLVIAGPDYGYLKVLRKLSSSLGISDKVIFTGFLPEKLKKCALVEARVVVNVEPSNVYGLIPLEAAACKTPVIVSKENAVSWLVNKGSFGFSVNYGDVRQLSRQMYTLLTDDTLNKQLGENGRHFVFKYMSWPKIVSMLEKVYKECLMSRN